MRSYIYGLRDPRDSQVRYIGKTCSPRQRFSSHIAGAEKGRRGPKNDWIRQLLAEGLRPEFVVLESDPTGGWEVAECAWIAYLQTAGCDLLNLHPGGHGGPYGRTWTLSEETKAKMRKPKSAETRLRMKAYLKANPRKMSPEARAKLSTAHRGLSATPTARAAMSAAATGSKNPMYGRTHSPEARAKISAAAKNRIGPKNPFYGKKHTPETIEKLRAAAKARS